MMPFVSEVIKGKGRDWWAVKEDRRFPTRLCARRASGGPLPPMGQTAGAGMP